MSYAKSKIKGTTLNGVDIPCSICSFANELQLRRHIEKVHDHKCEKCGYISFNLSRFEAHTRIYHVWDCDSCEFTTETEDELENHRIDEHEHKCEHCDFETTNRDDLSRHIEEVHTLKCSICDVTFKFEKKRKTHICKVEVRNPTFKSFYTRSWYDSNGCNSVYCTIQNQDIAWLHSKQCWADKEHFCWRPSPVLGKPIELETVPHILSNGHLQNGEVNWPLIIKDIGHFTNEE